MRNLISWKKKWYQIEYSKNMFSLFETVKILNSISLRNLYISLKSIKENKRNRHRQNTAVGDSSHEVACRKRSYVSAINDASHNFRQVYYIFNLLAMSLTLNSWGIWIQEVVPNSENPKVLISLLKRWNNRFRLHWEISIFHWKAYKKWPILYFFWKKILFFLQTIATITD